MSEVRDLDENEKEKVNKIDKEIETPDKEKDDASKALFLEASNLVLHIPSWVIPQHEIFYKVAYLQVRKDEKAKTQPARVRTALIRNLMNRMITKMGKFFEEENKKKEKEKKNESRRF